MKTDRKEAVYRERYRLRDEIARVESERDLVEAWVGLDSLLAGTWGTENLDALGGGKLQIERAFVVLTALLDQRMSDV